VSDQVAGYRLSAVGGDTALREVSLDDWSRASDGPMYRVSADARTPLREVSLEDWSSAPTCMLCSKPSLNGLHQACIVYENWQADPAVAVLA
jgi:hypothetical protein